MAKIAEARNVPVPWLLAPVVVFFLIIALLDLKRQLVGPDPGLDRWLIAAALVATTLVVLAELGAVAVGAIALLKTPAARSAANVISVAFGALGLAISAVYAYAMLTFILIGNGGV